MDVPWRLIPAHEARPISPPAEARARGWIRDLIAQLRPRRELPTEVGPSEERLEPVEEARLERIAPEPPRHAQRAALDALRGHADRAIVLRPDDGGWDAVLDASATGGPEVVTSAGPGSTRDVLPQSLLDRLADPEPLHLSRIERWFVRHHDGLGAIRALLATLGAREGPWTADLGRWSWAWMRHVLPEARGLPSPWMPAPLDGDALQAWLGGDENVRVRGRGGAPDASIFRSLAMRSRGEAGTALAIWRAALRDGFERAVEARAAEEATEENAGEEAAEEEAEAPPGTVWLRRPDDLDLPTTVGLGRDDLLLIHAVLLHGGATSDVLARSLNVGTSAVEAALRPMEARGVLVRSDDGAVRAAALALPAIRTRLDAEAFAGDAP